MPRVRRSTGRKSARKSTRKTRSRSPRRVKSATKVRRARKATPKKVRRVGSKKVNKWVSFVRQMAKKHNMTFKQAMMSPMVKNAYKKA